MKTNKETAKAFAQGRTATAGHLHTNGRDIFSYSTMIAQRQDNGAILLTSQYYSVTTSRHAAHIIGACTGDIYRVRHIEKPTEIEHAQNLAELENRAHDYRRKAQRARSEQMKEYYTTQAVQASEIAGLYLLAFCI